MGGPPKIGVGPPKSSILIVFSIIINHPFWGPTPIFGNTQIIDGSQAIVQVYSHKFDRPFPLAVADKGVYKTSRA